MVSNHIVLTELGGLVILSVLGIMVLVRIAHLLRIGVYHLKEIAIHLRQSNRAHKSTHSHSAETPASQDPSDVDGANG